MAVTGRVAARKAAVHSARWSARCIADIQPAPMMHACPDGGSRRLANSKSKIAAFAAAVLVIPAGLTWYFASPAWTLHQMKAAADGNDPEALNAFIDYPALREDLKAEIMSQMSAEAKKDKSGLGGLGLAIGTALVGPMIDRLISPAGVRAALMAKREQAQFGPAKSATSALRLPSDPVIERRGFSEFVVARKQRSTSRLVFKRHGLSWKLSGVELPIEPVTQPPGELTFYSASRRSAEARS